MRNVLLVGAASLALFGACAQSPVDDDETTGTGSSGAASNSSSSGSTDESDDAGTSSSSGGPSSSSSSSSGGSSSSGSVDAGADARVDAGPDASIDAGSDGGGSILPVLSVVKPGAQLLGVTTGSVPHIVYRVGTNLEAVPVAGGAVEVLTTALAATDDARVSGGVIAWFSNLNTVTNIFSTTNIWTKQNGTRIISSPSHGFFVASEDGSRMALEIGATNAITGTFAVTSTSTPNIASPALSGTNAVNLQASYITNATCPPTLRFAGTTFVAAYCTGTLSTQTVARLVTVASGETTATVRLDESANLQPIVAADASGTKLAVFARVGAQAESRLVLLNGAVTTIAPVELGTKSFVLAKDGSTLTYITEANQLKRATVAATPVKTPLENGLVKLLSISSDRKKFAFATLDSGNDDYDIKTVDVAAPTPTVTTLVAAATAYGVSFTGDDARLAYMENYNTTTGKGALKTKPFAGGAETILAASAYAGYPADLGSSVLVETAMASIGGSTTDFSVNYDVTDGVLGGTPKPGATNVFVTSRGASTVWSGKTFVFMTTGATPGVSKLVVP